MDKDQAEEDMVEQDVDKDQAVEDMVTVGLADMQEEVMAIQMVEGADISRGREVSGREDAVATGDTEDRIRGVRRSCKSTQ